MTSGPCSQPLDRTFLQCWRLHWEHSWSWILGIPHFLVSPTLWNTGQKSRAGQDLWMGDYLQVGGRQQWGVANRKSLNCVQNPDLPVETWLTFHMRWIQFLVWTWACPESERAPLWILLGWCHSPDLLNQTDGAGLREQIQQWKTAPASLLPITSCIPVLHDFPLPQESYNQLSRRKPQYQYLP